MRHRSTFVTVTNTRDNKVTKKKGLFWLTLLDVSGLLAPFEAAQHGGDDVQNHLTHIWEERKMKVVLAFDLSFWGPLETQTKADMLGQWSELSD